MGNDKRGVALPIVLVFMLMSHLIYLGLLRLNCAKIESLTLLQSDYVGKVQQGLAMRHLAQDHAPKVQQIQEEVQEGIHYLTRRACRSFDQVDWVYQGDHSGVAKVTKHNDQGLFIYGARVYLSSDLVKIPGLSDTLPLVGQVDAQQNLTMDPILSSRPSAELVKLKGYLDTSLSNGYEVSDEMQEAYTKRWSYHYQGPRNYRFNSGEIYVQNARGQRVQLVGRIQEQEPFKRAYIPLEEGRYYIEWFAYLLSPVQSFE